MYNIQQKSNHIYCHSCQTFQEMGLHHYVENHLLDDHMNIFLLTNPHIKIYLINVLIHA